MATVKKPERVKFQYLRGVSHISYGFNHVQAHLDAAMSMIAPGNRQAGNAVVTVAEKLDAQTMILRRELIETCKEIVQYLHELLGAAVTCQSFDNILQIITCTSFKIFIRIFNTYKNNRHELTHQTKLESSSD